MDQPRAPRYPVRSRGDRRRMTTAAQRLIDVLARQGIDRAFCVPGESYIALLDALHAHPRIDLVTCRSEGGAGFMAVADAKLTGRPGWCWSRAGPARATPPSRCTRRNRTPRR
jgi:2-succinyl-5-enolpyruvyl-6-hydroxy-3-cyclohexene-1-carboxylate synthase